MPSIRLTLEQRLMKEVHNMQDLIEYVPCNLLFATPLLANSHMKDVEIKL
jgi:hypothetical protein